MRAVFAALIATGLLAAPAMAATPTTPAGVSTPAKVAPVAAKKAHKTVAHTTTQKTPHKKMTPAVKAS